MPLISGKLWRRCSNFGKRPAPVLLFVRTTGKVITRVLGVFRRPEWLLHPFIDSSGKPERLYQVCFEFTGKKLPLRDRK